MGVLIVKNKAMKKEFAVQLNDFAKSLGSHISQNDEWTIKGFIDVFRNIYIISADTKVVSKILELHLFPQFLGFAEKIGYRIELATYQNWYPDLTFVKKDDEAVKFAVDLKTTYLLDDRPGFCNGFTLGSHGEYFINRDSHKNIQYPYNQYSGHFCLGIIYSRTKLSENSETRAYSIDELDEIPSVIKHFTFFAVEKWRIASDKGGSGNTANIGSIRFIDDILSGNGVFAKAGEGIFDDYWANFGKMQVESKDGKRKGLSSFEEYVTYRGLSKDIMNPRASWRKVR
ncbi:hypothetical protein FACS1894167_12540 [Synergistales bacterium]|nr:hypothetical protein FACS1894167_12540 [Synergistales bacterium]